MSFVTTIFLSAFGSQLSGEKEGIFDLILHCMFVVPDYLPEQKRFDILVLSLTFIINMIEHCKPNRWVPHSGYYILKSAAIKARLQK